MANISSYDFTAADGTLLHAISGWSKIYGYTGDLKINNGMLSNQGIAGLGTGGYQCSLGTPPSADYDVSCDMVVKTVITNCFPGVCGRIQSGSTTMYQLYHNGTTNKWTVSRRVSDTNTILGEVDASAAAGNTYRIKLRMQGNQISGYVNDSLVLGPFTDNSITAAGLPGLRRFENSNSTSTTGIHQDNFSADTIESGGGGATTTIGATLASITGSVASKSSPKTAISATLANVSASIDSGSGSLRTTITATLANIAGAITSTGSTANGTFTSEVLKDYAGNVLASVSLNYVRFYNDTTGALVLNKTGVSTNASGIVTFSDAALVAGTTYRVDWETAAGSRRMPRKAAA